MQPMPSVPGSSYTKNAVPHNAHDSFSLILNKPRLCSPRETVVFGTRPPLPPHDMKNARRFSFKL